MASIRFRCYYCYRVHTVDAQSAGRKGQCVCGKIMIVPEGSSDPTAATLNLPLASPGEAEAGEVEGALSDWGQNEEAVPAAAAEPAGRESPTSESTPVTPALGDDFQPVEAPAAAERRVPDVEAHLPVNTKGNLMGKLQFSLAAIVAVLWLVHTSPWIYLVESQKPLLKYPLPEVLGVVPDTHYMTLDRGFWSTILAGLALALVFDGIGRCRRARREPFEEIV